MQINQIPLKANFMSFDKNLLRLRKSRNLTQDQMAELVGMHVTSIKTYETGKTQPSLDGLKKIITAFGITADELLFDEHERDPSMDLKLAFEAVTQMNEDDKQTVLSLIEAMMLKHQARTLLTREAS
ncbi:helix-turn-helix transcriptional regulator [uncultured Tateyamaria sp.]|uniref:helix-turn-helix domain-containing protein n=1 Tax=uncultured Tateyamaria sp. TaxID=455651 RepID=UPI0026357F9E|nr:helix-turn-helix transcriptional regulator [uncultured Tateyamaria sp.]